MNSPTDHLIADEVTPPVATSPEELRQEELERTLRRIRSIIFNAYLREYLKQNPQQNNGRL